MVDIAAFRDDLRKDLETGRRAFEGKYSAEIAELMGLSREEIDRLTPNGADLQAYDQLIALVKQASKHNISQAQLFEHIRQLGDIAVRIAKKTSRLAAIAA